MIVKISDARNIRGAGKRQTFCYGFLERYENVSLPHIPLPFSFSRYHGHRCIKVAAEDKGKARLMAERRERTRRKNRALRDAGYTLVTMRECKFNAMIQEDEELRVFCQEWDPTFGQRRGQVLDQSDVIEAIDGGRIFGIVTATVSLPTSWTDTFSHPLPPSQYFSFFPPLFVN